MYRSHLNNEINESNIGEKVYLCGWVHRRRDHGGVIFIDIRDRYGFVQLVSDPIKFPEAHITADKIRPEYVIQICGTVKKRPEGQENKKISTGQIEVTIEKCEIINASKTPPFEIDQEKEVNEEIRLKYRYLDLRRERMKQNIVLRHKVVKKIRDYFDREGFLEIETPILIKGTPEGSREYIVPSRLHHGEFYVLPQSPQQLKQLLMVAGMDKYLQIARCFRDEDQRGDRQPEFTQVDIEMAFADDKEIMKVTEECLIETGKSLVNEKKIQQIPFPKLSWKEAMENFGSDKPDLRYEMKIKDISFVIANCDFSVFKDAILNQGVVKALMVENGGSFSRKDIDELTEIAISQGSKGLAYLQIEENLIKGSIAKFFTPEELSLIKESCEAKNGDIIFFGAGDFETVCLSLGQVRIACAKKLNLVDDEILSFVWITDFPLFEKDKIKNTLTSCHHPFTKPKNEDLKFMESEPEKVKAYAYDIVLNGYEIGGGSVRIHDSKQQKQIFDILGISDKNAKERFGHLLEAFEFGAPPHAGLALGLERLIMIYRNEKNIREVMAFPKDQQAKDLMLGAPSKLPQENLDEVSLSINQKET